MQTFQQAQLSGLGLQFCTRLARPRYETPATKGARTWVSLVRSEAQRLGTPLMPWQSKGARLISELRASCVTVILRAGSCPGGKQVVVSVCRQQGKTVLSRAVVGAKARSEANLDVFGTAQSRMYAAKHVVNMGDEYGFQVQTRRGVGSERVDWPNGSRYAPISPTAGGGHGDSIDFMLVDEGWALLPHVIGGIRPAMIARPHSQMLIISTMGTVESHVWNQIVARGRDSVDDPGSDLAYIEYSAGSDEDTWDERLWHTWMPALGRTVRREDIRSAMADVEPAEAVRAFGNRTTVTMSALFPQEWLQKAWQVFAPPERLVLAVDVNESPAGASIMSGHVTETGEGAVRLIEWRAGSPEWVPQKIAEIIGARQVEAVSADLGGPAKQIHAELEAVCEEALIPFVDRYPRLFGGDCARFYDNLRQGQILLEDPPRYTSR